MNPAPAGTAAAPAVIVFRRRLLAWSETFVASQALALPHWRAVFAGLSRDRSGQDLLADAPCHLLDHYARYPALARLGLSALGQVPARWCAALAAEGPALIHAHFISSGLAAMPLARALDVPLIVTVHGYDILDQRVSARDRRRRAALFDQATQIIAVSDFLLSRLLALGCPPDKAVRHYIGTRVEPDPPGDAAAPSDPATPLQILFVGRLVAHKGCHDALEAFAQVRRTMPTARLSVIGDGLERAALEARAAQIGGVEFHGVQTPAAVRRALTAAAVLCCPSGHGSNGWQEAFGLVFIEAQACGTPVVSYRTGGIAEAVENGNGGYLVEPGDVGALGARLQTLLADAGLRRSQGERGRARVRRDFDLHRQSAALETLYATALNRAPGAA